MTIWFTSDTHWQHANIIAHCRRPFSTVEEMNERLIDNWNSVVARGDVVYHLGDFAITWKKHDAVGVTSLLRRLRGSIHLIYGNHDRDAVKLATGFSWQGEYKRIRVDKQPIVLFHYPIASWHGIHRDAWHLHGHCHGNLTENLSLKRLDVGVDCWNYSPVPFDVVRDEMQRREFVPVDHHA